LGGARDGGGGRGGRPFDAERLADGCGVGVQPLDALRQGAEPGQDAHRHGGWEIRRQHGNRLAGRREAAAIAFKVFLRRPTHGGGLHGGVEIHHRAEPGGIQRLLDNVRIRDQQAQRGQFARDVVFERDHLRRQPVVGAADIIGV